jgi:glycosyltransferase involved in cell wall biosynthesis
VLSRLHPKKGLETLVDAFLDLPSQNASGHWRLVIAGDGEARYVHDLHARVRDQKGRDRVLFTGWLDGPERHSALYEASLLVLTSHQENFALSVVEALACSVPVLVSEQVNLAQEVEEAKAGWVVPIEKTLVKRCLVEALGQEGERSRRGRSGREWVGKRFRWPLVADQLKDLYRSILSAPQITGASHPSDSAG